MNTTYRFRWEQILTEPFLAEISAIAKASPHELQSDLTTLLSGLFNAVGGLPLANSQWSLQHRTVVARKLLHESIACVLKNKYRFQNQQPGVITRHQHGKSVAVYTPSLDPNQATFEELEALPVIGKALAERIIAERRAKGPFTSKSDLINRVKGLGDEGYEVLEGVFVFSDAGGRVIHGTLDDDFRALLAASPAKRGNALVSALEEIAMFVAGHPHPTARLRVKREDLEPESLAEPRPRLYKADVVRMLADKTYYFNLIELLESARKHIDVCMFYVALPNPEHPTRRLLDTLVRRAAAGCRVRVLVDQDGKDDPYGSRLINAASVEFLTANGIDTRGDATESLLHSKFVVIDEEAVVIGSHNWTAGSFFNYSDLSVVVSGRAASQMWQERFERLWSRGQPFQKTATS